MLKSVFAGVTAAVLMTSVAFAQDAQTITREKTTIQNPDGSQSVQANKTENTIDADGNQTTSKKSFSKTEDMNGSQMSRSRQERTVSPDGSATVNQETTTTKTSQ